MPPWQLLTKPSSGGGLLLLRRSAPLTRRHCGLVLHWRSYQDNKAEGSLKALFAEAYKLPAFESWTYDRLLGISLESDADVILADLGAAQGHRMIPWFRDFYKVMQESGLDLRWTALGVVDSDIASARSVIEWGGELQNTVDYVIVHNHFQEGVASSWENPKLEA